MKQKNPKVMREARDFSHVRFTNRFQMFAKANITEEYDLKNVIYKREYFKYPFENQIFPDFIDIVPLVSILNTSPSIEDLDILYDTYINNQQRHVEGFIIIDNTFKNIQKYVRYKDGKATPHILK